MEPNIKIYIEKGGVFVGDGKYKAYIQDNSEYLKKDTTYYEFTLKLPDEEVARIEKQSKVEPDILET